MLTHNSTTVKDEPKLSSIDKSRLCRNAFADPGQPDDKATYRFAHHFVEHGRLGSNNTFVTGNMYLHKEGLQVALEATKKMHDDEAPRRHLLTHAKAINLDTKATASIMHNSTSASKTEHKAENVLSDSHSAISDFSLRGVAEAITACESLEPLKAIEDECLLHFAEAEKSGKNWIQKNEAKSMSGQIQQLVSYRRRAILSLPSIKKAQEEYALGQTIGRKI